MGAGKPVAGTACEVEGSVDMSVGLGMSVGVGKGTGKDFGIGKGFGTGKCLETGKDAGADMLVKDGKAGFPGLKVMSSPQIEDYYKVPLPRRTEEVSLAGL